MDAAFRRDVWYAVAAASHAPNATLERLSLAEGRTNNVADMAKQEAWDILDAELVKALNDIIKVYFQREVANLEE